MGVTPYQERIGIDALASASVGDAIATHQKDGNALRARMQVAIAPVIGLWDAGLLTTKALVGIVLVPLTVGGRLTGLICDNSSMSADVYLQARRVLRALESLLYTVGSTAVLIPSLVVPTLIMKVGDLSGVNCRWEKYGAANIKERIQTRVNEALVCFRKYSRDPKVQRYAQYVGLGMLGVALLYTASGMLNGSQNGPSSTPSSTPSPTPTSTPSASPSTSWSSSPQHSPTSPTGDSSWSWTSLGLCLPTSLAVLAAMKLCRGGNGRPGQADAEFL